MLLEEQAAELLSRCERILGPRLQKIRADLKSPKSRVAAVWELLVVESVARMGHVSYEPRKGSSPDILFTEHKPIFSWLFRRRGLWIEVTFLHPRFEREEQLARMVVDWIREEAGSLGIPSGKFTCHFRGDVRRREGPILTLPKEHQKKQFMLRSEVVELFGRVQNAPDNNHSTVFPDYSLSITYSPGKSATSGSHGGGLLQEAAKDPKKHAVYMKLKRKARQHRMVSGPRVICIGSDQSPAMKNFHSPGNPTVPEVVWKVFRENNSLSAALLVSIEDRPSGFGLVRAAKGDLYINPRARNPLSEREKEMLLSLDFNRWKYSRPLGQAEPRRTDFHKRASGGISVTSGKGEMKLEIPTDVLMGCLSSDMELSQHLKGYARMKCICENWQVTSCEFKEGKIEQGQAPTVELTFKPPHENVYGWDE